MKWCQELYDYIIVGGGLQGGLLTMAISHHQPDATILLIEQGSSVGGNHTWSFHVGDVPESAKAWLEPLVTSRWSDYVVRFPGFERRVDIAYASINSHHFARVISKRLEGKIAAEDLSQVSGAVQTLPVIRGRVKSKRMQSKGQPTWRPQSETTSRLMLETQVESVTSDSVRVGDKEFEAKVVIDCRGPERAKLLSLGRCGYQKFYGFEIELEADWPESYPVIMDCHESQREGFRFMYTLPFSERRVLVEDTQFSGSSSINRRESLKNVTTFIESKTNAYWRIIREECGCLPMPLAKVSMPSEGDPLIGGYAGGWFHAATGYSFPLAVRFAETVATSSADRVADSVRRLAETNRPQASAARFLNRLLFRLVKPRQRYEIFRRFYRVLSEEAIARFYSHQFTSHDLRQIVIGRPPSRLSPLRFIHSLLKER